jgi:hypothetical protein
MLQNLQCWVAPRQYALGQAGSAFDATGQLVSEAQRAGVANVVTQVLWAGARLQP